MQFKEQVTSGHCPGAHHLLTFLLILESNELLGCLWFTASLHDIVQKVQAGSINHRWTRNWFVRTRLKRWVRASHCTQVRKAVAGVKKLLLSRWIVTERVGGNNAISILFLGFLRQGATPG